MFFFVGEICPKLLLKNYWGHRKSKPKTGNSILHSHIIIIIIIIRSSSSSSSSINFVLSEAMIEHKVRMR